jgi:hypothetical protein
MIPKLSAVCYAVRSMFHISDINTLKSIYFAYFHSITQYRIIFWGNSSNSRKIFTLQQKIIRIMVGARPGTPCRNLFKKLELLPVQFQYIFSLMNFFVNIQENFQINSSVHCIYTRNNHHKPIYHAFRKVHSILESECSIVYHIVSQILRMKRHNLKQH